MGEWGGTGGRVHCGRFVREGGRERGMVSGWRRDRRRRRTRREKAAYVATLASGRTGGDGGGELMGWWPVAGRLACTLH